MQRLFLTTILFSLATLVWSKNPIPEPIVQSGYSYEVSSSVEYEYDVTTYTIVMPAIDKDLYVAISNYAASRRRRVTDWYGTLNGVVYHNRGSFFSGLSNESNVVDVYERFNYTHDKRFFADLIFTDNTLTFSFYEDNQPFFSRQVTKIRTWFSTSFLRRLAR